MAHYRMFPSNYTVRFHDLGLVWGVLGTPLCLGIWCCMWTDSSDAQSSLSRLGGAHWRDDNIRYLYSPRKNVVSAICLYDRDQVPSRHNTAKDSNYCP